MNPWLRSPTGLPWRDQFVAHVRRRVQFECPIPVHTQIGPASLSKDVTRARTQVSRSMREDGEWESNHDLRSMVGGLQCTGEFRRMCTIDMFPWYQWSVSQKSMYDGRVQMGFKCMSCGHGAVRWRWCAYEWFNVGEFGSFSWHECRYAGWATVWSGVGVECQVGFYLQNHVVAPRR